MDLLQQPGAQLPSLRQIALEADADPAEAARLFPDSQAVYEAAAEQALLWLNDSCIKAVVKVDPDDAVAQFGALGEAYLEWAVSNEPYFRLISDQGPVRLSNCSKLMRYHDAMQELMLRMMERARDAGHLPPEENIPLMVLSARSFAYGLARMVIDGKMREWYPQCQPMASARQVLHDFMIRIARGSLPRSSQNPPLRVIA